MLFKINKLNSKLNLDIHEELKRVRFSIMSKLDKGVVTCVCSRSIEKEQDVPFLISESLARIGKKVVLVCSNSFELSGQAKGDIYIIQTIKLDEYLLNGVLPDKLLNPIDKSVSVIDSNNITNEVGDNLSSDKILRLKSYLEKTFDFIIFDAPALEDNYDALVFAKISDGIIFIKGDKDVPINELSKNAKLVNELNKEVLGLVVSNVKN